MEECKGYLKNPPGPILKFLFPNWVHPPFPQPQSLLGQRSQFPSAKAPQDLRLV